MERFAPIRMRTYSFLWSFKYYDNGKERTNNEVVHKIEDLSGYF